MTQEEFLDICAEGSYEEVEEAIKAGADVNKHGMFHDVPVAPLFIACMKENMEGADALLWNGANPADGYIATVINEDETMARAMAGLGADVNSLDDHGFSALLRAVCANKPDVVKWLIEIGAKVNLKTEGGCNVLTYAAIMASEDNEQKISPQIISLLMKRGSDYGDALIIAVKAGNIRFVRELIKNGADMGIRCVEGQTPLSAALMNSKKAATPKMIELLVSNGADVNEIYDFGEGTVSNPLNVCISVERTDLAEILLRHGADPNFRDYSGRTSLVFAIVTSDEMTEVFLEHGADPNIPDNEGRTPLMLAAIDGGNEPGIIESLVVHGANVNIQDKNGLTALMWSVIGRDRSTDFLISGMIRTGGIRAEGAEAWIALASLYNAVKRETQLEIVRTLIARGADVNLRDSKAMNALAYAVMNDDEEIADILISAGSKFNFETM